MAMIAHGEDLQLGMLTGCEQLRRIAAPLYGPGSRTVLFEPKYDIPMAAGSIRDILPDFALEDPVEQLGAGILADAAKKIHDGAGSGAATTIVLTGAMLEEGTRAIAAGANPVQLRTGALLAAQTAVEQLRSRAVPVEDSQTMKQVLRTAVGHSDAPEILMGVFDKVGMDGIVTITDSQLSDTVVEAGGIRYDYGATSPLFLVDGNGKTATLNHPHILLVEQKLEDLSQLEKLLVQCIEEDAQLLIIAKDYSNDFLGLLLRNVQQGVFRVVAAKAPGHGETRARNMQALALRCGAALITEDCGLDIGDCGLEICGQAEQAVITLEHTKLLGTVCHQEEERQRMKRRLLREMEAEKNQELKERILVAQMILDGGGAEVLVGGTTEVEMFERKRNLENALATARCARRGGVVTGGGIAYLEAVSAVRQLADTLEGDRQRGAMCVLKALCTPTTLIANNAGDSGSYVTAHILETKESNLGYDAAAHRFCNLTEAGILDPADMVCSALQIAAETAFTLLTSEAGIV